MKCPNCNAELGPADRFCGSCGQPAPAPAPPKGAFCQHCGAQLPAGSRFCGDCGRPVGQSKSGAPAPAKPPTGPATEPQKSLLDDIAGKLREGAADQAKEMLQDYLQDKAQDSTAWIMLGNAELDLGNDAAAEQAYWYALRLNPQSPKAYTGLGIIARRRKDNEQAMKYYRQAVEADPKYAHAYSSMAVIELKRGNDRQAMAHAEKAWELDKTDPVIAANLSVAYHYMGRTADRDRLYEEARRLGYRSLPTLDQIFRGELSMRE